jgi:hypothetical protein
LVAHLFVEIVEFGNWKSAKGWHRDPIVACAQNCAAQDYPSTFTSRSATYCRRLNGKGSWDVTNRNPSLIAMEL